MIEKLKAINPYDETEIDMDTNSVGGMVYENTPLIQKLNELVDAVNELQLAKDVMVGRIDMLNNAIFDIRNAIDELQLKVAILEEDAHPTAKTEPDENVQDKFAEQRKWIGKLCWYKLCEGDTWKVGRLEKIQENADAGYPFVFDGLCYKICEPVKPDDDIIYKGCNNE